MKIPKEDLITILSKFNPWWRKESIPDLPTWTRAMYGDLIEWVLRPPAHRAIMISGARQVGKTTLILQAIQELLRSGINPSNIVYATFDHPVFKLAGLEAVLEAWREIEPKQGEVEYLFLDEAQFIKNFGTWTKHQIDFSKYRRIIFTGSATPLLQDDHESGVGRWHTLKLSTLSFFEYLQIKQITLPTLPKLEKIEDLIHCNKSQLHQMSEACLYLTGHFHEYLIRGGFPQTALVENITQAQRLLREDIIDKVLKRDMTALFGVRRVLELEQMFIFLCMHQAGLQDIQTISKELGVSKSTVQNFLDLLESTHLIYRLSPHGYGKEILRARYKIYLTDAAIAPAILLKGKSLFEDATEMGNSVENTIIAHLFSHTNIHPSLFTYWRNAKQKEVDFLIEDSKKILPIEVKYQSHEITNKELTGLIDICEQKSTISNGCIITKLPHDIGIFPNSSSKKLIKIPACLFCYWLGEAELKRSNFLF